MNAASSFRRPGGHPTVGKKLCARSGADAGEAALHRGPQRSWRSRILGANSNEHRRGWASPEGGPKSGRERSEVRSECRSESCSDSGTDEDKIGAIGADVWEAADLEGTDPARCKQIRPYPNPEGAIRSDIWTTDPGLLRKTLRS